MLLLELKRIIKHVSNQDTIYAMTVDLVSVCAAAAAAAHSASSIFCLQD